MSIVTAAQVVEGLYAWFGENRWFLADKTDKLDPQHEAAAQQAMLLIAAGKKSAYRKLPSPARKLACLLTMDFLAKLMGPMRDRTWLVSIEDADPKRLQKAAWQAIEAEIRRSLPSGSGLH